MAHVQRREREKAEFRDLVLKAARKIVLREGFDGLSMRKIADAIEYAPGTIYLYFESREAIAHELCRQGFAQLLAALSPAAAIADPEERLRDVGIRYVEFGLKNAETYRLIFMEDAKYADAIFKSDGENDPGDLALGLLVQAFAELQAQGRIRSTASPQTLAEAFWAMGHGIVSLKITCHEFPTSSAGDLNGLISNAFFDGLLEKKIGKAYTTKVCCSELLEQRANIKAECPRPISERPRRSR